MTNKERYIQWSEVQSFMPIFMQPWWLDAVCAGKEWDVLLCEDADGNILGALPYLLRRHAGLKYILMPQMSQVGGIWVDPKISADRWQISEVCRMLKEQLDQMGLAYYYQHFAPGSLCIDIVKTLGFNTKERVTYRINDLSNLDQLILSFSKNKRRQLQKALSLHAEHTMDGEEFYRFHAHCLKAKGKTIRYTREFLLVLEKKAKRNGQYHILSICDADKKVHAAVFLVWDKSFMYYLIPAIDPSVGSSGAGALLVLEAIKLAREKHLLFDFEGSIERGIAQHYKQFGSQAVTYYSVEKYYKPFFRLFFWIQKLREWWMR